MAPRVVIPMTIGIPISVPPTYEARRSRCVEILIGIGMTEAADAPLARKVAMFSSS